MHKYEIISRIYDKHWKFKPSDFEQVLNLVKQIIASGKREEVEFFLKGKESTSGKFIQAAELDKEDYWAKKEQNYKQVLVGTGVTGFVKKPVWVRK